MFRRREPRWIAAGGWLRFEHSPLGKSRKLADGELLELTLAATADSDELRAAAYENLVKIREDLAKAITASFIAAAFGLLVYEGALSGFNAGGLELDKLSFMHAALVGMSVTGLWTSMAQTRASYISSWFIARFERAAASERAVLLLRYPAAFWYFQFMRGNRGYPTFVFPRRNSYAQLIPVLLILLAIVIGAIGATALWFAVALQVWHSTYPSPLASKATVVACGMISLLAAMAPRFGDRKRWYEHYGLSNLLTEMPEPRRPRAFWRIGQAQIRMGLVKPPVAPPSSEN